MSTPLSIRPGERAEITLGYSEVCMFMKVAGKTLPVELVETPQYLSDAFSYHAQIFDADGNKMGGPVTLGEAGIYRTEQGFFYHY